MSITSRVKGFYSKHTYPNYPILARPLWQYGYLGSSLFSGFLYESVYQTRSSIFSYNIEKSFYSEDNKKNILLIGCGEILPYISRKFEPSNHRIYCVDLSGASLKRASLRLKLALNTKPIQFIEDDINHFLDSTDLMFDHVDCFGVAHHLDSPSLTLKKIHDHLKVGGTCRIMVYNYPARWWIHAIASIFKLCGYSYNSSKDIVTGRKWLNKLKKLYPQSILSYYLDSVGGFLLDNPARFADTFLHPREIRYDIEKWFSLFFEAGFKVFGLYDRYLELEELSDDFNPLYNPLDPSTLKELSDLGYYQGNLELYLSPSKPEALSVTTTHSSTLKDYPLKKRVLIFIKEFSAHLLKSSPFKSAGGSRYRLWINWIRSIFFNVKRDSFSIIDLFY